MSTRQTQPKPGLALLVVLALVGLGLHAQAAEVVDSVQFGKLHNSEPGSKSDSMVAHQFSIAAFISAAGNWPPAAWESG